MRGTSVEHCNSYKCTDRSEVALAMVLMRSNPLIVSAHCAFKPLKEHLYKRGLSKSLITELLERRDHTYRACAEVFPIFHRLCAVDPHVRAKTCQMVVDLSELDRIGSTPKRASKERELMLMWTLTAAKQKRQRLPLIEAITALYWLHELPNIGVEAFSRLFPLQTHSVLLSQLFEALTWMSPYLSSRDKMTILSIAHLQPTLPPAISFSDTVPVRERRLICTTTSVSGQTAVMDINVFLDESLDNLFG